MRCCSVSVGVVVLLCLQSPSWGQEPASIKKALQQRVIEPDQAWHEVQEYTASRVLPMPEITTQKAWETYINGRREAVFNDVIFRGKAAQWCDAQLKTVWGETIAGGPGYKIRKLRYEAIPGLWIPAVLYEPENLTGKVPVVLNVNGHDANGKAADYKQIRCINQAKRGMLAFNVEWPGMGQLRTDGFTHYKINQIDLCGTSGIATHYLYMSRGIDVLLEHPHADPKRVAVAGLSGGGWQTIFISSLDSRVTLSNPVAGYSSFVTRAEFVSDLGDSEQTPVDLGMVADYKQLTAMRAPRPTLLTFNAEDNCCFRADHALHPLVEAAQPAFNVYGKGDSLRTHVNTDPGNHNFLLDNRQQLYKMLGDFFYADDANWQDAEIPVEDELKSADDLFVELPKENLDFHQIAMELAKDLPAPHAAAIEVQRARLKNVLRLDDYDVQPVQSEAIAIDGGTANSYRLKLGSDWTVPATELLPAGQTRSTVILIGDGGRSTTAEYAAGLLKQGKRVLAVDPFYFGESKISQRDFLYGLLVSTVGERPLGIQAAQLAAVAEWILKDDSRPVEIHAIGKRTGLIALATAAVHPGLVARLELTGGFSSLKQIIEQNMAVNQAPELFCFGLLEVTDIPEMKSLAAPCEIIEHK